ISGKLSGKRRASRPPPCADWKESGAPDSTRPGCGFDKAQRSPRRFPRRAAGSDDPDRQALRSRVVPLVIRPKRKVNVTRRDEVGCGWLPLPFAAAPKSGETSYNTLMEELVNQTSSWRKRRLSFSLKAAKKA